MGRYLHCKKCHRPKKTECICGRPEGINAEVEALLKEALQMDMPVYKAVKYAGTTETTFYSHCKKYPEFLERMKRAKYFATKIARVSIIKDLPNNPELALRYLSLKESEEFNTKTTQVNDGEVTVNLADEAKKRLGKYVDDASAANADTTKQDQVRDLDGRFGSGAPKGKKMLDL